VLLDALESVGQVVIAGHISPDGDALGSALAVGLALRSLGREVIVSFGDDPMVVPETLRHLPGQDMLVPPAALPSAPQLLLTFDTASLDRLGLVAPLVSTARRCFAVDHHASYTGYAPAAVVDAAAPATAVLAAHLIDLLGVPIDRDIAACLYTGLSTDTGSFRYAGTTSATHELAARLLGTGIEHDVIARRIYDTVSHGYLLLLGAALARITLEPEAVNGRGLVWTVIPAADRTAHGLGMDTVEGVIDVVRAAQEAEVAVVLKEDDAGHYRVSMRSKGPVDVGSAATAFGGGGHRSAAGFSSDDDVPAIVGRLREVLGAEA
jgi:phosphoesterase RecJ-like protein